MASSNSTDLSFPSAEHCSTFDNIAKILLIGETGSGKSTLVDYLNNYFHKSVIPFKHPSFPTEQFPHHELNTHANTTQHIFTDSTTNKQYLFVDTPGLSDAHNIEQNEINIKKIIHAATQSGNLTSIIIVINGSKNQLTTHLHSVITRLNGNIPDIILENVIVILTHVKKHESSFDLKLLNLHGKVYPFYMQNSAFVSDPQTWKNSIHDEIQIKSILQIIDSLKQISMDASIQMKEIRNEIKSLIHQAYLEVTQMQKIQDELNSTLKQTDPDYIQFETIEKIELIDSPYHNTLCSNCHQVCHHNCHLNETTIIDSQLFSQCSVINNDQCKQCQNHCSYKYHYYAKKTIQITFETLEDLLYKYDQTKQIIDKILKQKMSEIKIRYIQLCQICSGFNLTNEFEYLIKQLKIQSDLLKNLQTKSQAEHLILKLTKYTHATELNQEKYRRKRPSMQIINQEQSIERNSTDINHLKTVDLIELYHNTTDHTLITSILNELHRRAQGYSTDPLSTSNEILIINKSLEKYNHKNIQELSYSYHKLQQQIYNIIKVDILKILDVNAELLIENFIIQTLLDDKENNHQDTTISSFPVPDIQPISSSIHSISIGFSHLISPPYPSLDDPSPMPPLPPKYFPVIQQNNDQSQTEFCLEDYRYDSKSTASTDDDQPMNTQQQSTNLYNSNTDLPDSSKSPFDHLQDDEDFRLLDTSRLLSMYADANLQKNESRKDAIYDELERRCYGDYPTLIAEKKAFFHERININYKKTLGELFIAQVAIKQKIRIHLKNDDVTLINNIPSELIIEANALNYLITSKK